MARHGVAMCLLSLLFRDDGTTAHETHQVYKYAYENNDEDDDHDQTNDWNCPMWESK